MSESWATRQDVADHLNVSLDKVDQMVREGMPSIKLGESPQASRRFLLSKVDEWVEAQNGAAA